jgi:transposase
LAGSDWRQLVDVADEAKTAKRRSRRPAAELAAENARLRRENERLRMEREILKKTLRIFSEAPR